MSPEVMSGFNDAKEEVNIMRGCPQCYAERWIESAGETLSNYSRGWRILLSEVLLSPHECKSKEK